MHEKMTFVISTRQVNTINEKSSFKPGFTSFFCFERPSHYTLNVQHNVLHVSLRIVVKFYPEK